MAAAPRPALVRELTDLLEDARVGGVSDERLDAVGIKAPLGVVVDGHHRAVDAQQPGDLGIEQRRPSTVSPGLDQNARAYPLEELHHHPEIAGVLDDLDPAPIQVSSGPPHVIKVAEPVGHRPRRARGQDLGDRDRDRPRLRSNELDDAVDQQSRVHTGPLSSNTTGGGTSSGGLLPVVSEGALSRRPSAESEDLAVFRSSESLAPALSASASRGCGDRLGCRGAWPCPSPSHFAGTGGLCWESRSM